MRQVRLVGRVRGSDGKRADHLCRVADITRKQTAPHRGRRLDALDARQPRRRPRQPASRRRRWRAWPSRRGCRRAARRLAPGVHEILAHSPGLGFDRLPLPDPGDLFFDFEGDPMHPGGLEYLCGVLWQGERRGRGRRARARSPGAALPRLLGSRSRAGEGGLRRADGVPHAAPRPRARRAPLSLRALREDGAAPARLDARDGGGGGGRAAAHEPHGRSLPRGAGGRAGRGAELLDQEPRALLHARPHDGGRVGRRQPRHL